ncbi:hypothetical protein PV08_09582 [Exophiala spinifera]|uniref:Uncharacterized protein n=1 Tax=Exophiala spinifera TaxID=91928 RepID=A0A0D2B0S3_9EURO|nr:uncharacterized protein PV08_09582 [Exophiala spinifera]KIW12305.1 hypothetical protein PV08_09582 [Exophiala spinifera]
MAGLNPLPPSHVHSTVRLTHAQAHTYLSSFLEQTEIDAAYRPDSTLTERGPQAVSTGSNPNLTLHHLKRILQGIEGKQIISTLDLDHADADAVGATTTNTSSPTTKRTREAADADADGDQSKGAKRRQYLYESHEGRTGPADDEGDEPAVTTTEDLDGWQDAEEYALAQTEGNLDLTNEDRHPGADLPEPANPEEEAELLNVEVEDDAGSDANTKSQKPAVSKKDKDERRKLKKQRRKQEKTKTAEVKRRQAAKD